MSAVSKATTERGMLVDFKDLENCRTTSTGAGLLLNGLVTVGSFFSGNLPMAYLGAVSFAGNWMGHASAREVVVKDDLTTNTLVLRDLLTQKNDQIEAKDKLIQDQKAEIDRLKQINTELEEKVRQLEQAQKSFDELNDEHLQIIEQQKKQIEEGRGFLARLTGLIQGYEQRKTKLLEEIREARQEREKLQSDIKALLAEQKRINEELAGRIEGLGEVADRMNGAIKV